jgi:hypothetical protein
VDSDWVRLDEVGHPGRSTLARQDAAGSDAKPGTSSIRLVTQRLLDLRHARQQVKHRSSS